MKNDGTIKIHATCVSRDGVGILIRGLSGMGKSDLALRLISDGAQLVADDQVVLQPLKDNIIAKSPPILTGLLEVRGVGIIRMRAQTSAPIQLIVDLTELAKVERLPSATITDLGGIKLQKIDLCGFEASAVAKVWIALDLALSRTECINDQ